MHHHPKSTTLTPQPHNRSPPLITNLGQTTCLQRWRRRRTGRTVNGGIRTSRLAYFLTTVCHHQIWQDWCPPSQPEDRNKNRGQSRGRHYTHPLGALEPLVPRLHADVAACGSTWFPGWSSVATIRTGASALTITLSLHNPPSFFFVLLTFPHFSRRRPLITAKFQEQEKTVSDDFDDFPYFERSYQARNSVPSRSMVRVSLSLSSIRLTTLYSSDSARRKSR